MRRITGRLPIIGGGRGAEERRAGEQRQAEYEHFERVAMYWLQRRILTPQGHKRLLQFFCPGRCYPIMQDMEPLIIAGDMVLKASHWNAFAAEVEELRRHSLNIYPDPP